MENRFLKIDDNPDFIKDMENNAILNTNLAAVVEYKAKRKQDAKILSMEQEINMLKEELQKIKTHLNLS
jgi:hypothetical protein